MSVDGETIRLRAYDDGAIERVVVGRDEGHVYVCTSEEYEASHREGREPACVGFAMEFIIDHHGDEEA